MFTKETKRWLRAIALAKILFEEDGYHCHYLEGIENFIRRQTMYSPKINADLVPALYQTAKSQKVPMTKLVNGIIQDYLVKNGKIERENINYEPEKELGGLQRAQTKGRHEGHSKPLRPTIPYDRKEG